MAWIAASLSGIVNDLPFLVSGRVMVAVLPSTWSNRRVRASVGLKASAIKSRAASAAGSSPLSTLCGGIDVGGEVSAELVRLNPGVREAQPPGMTPMGSPNIARDDGT
jgi:hypothetical protein